MAKDRPILITGCPRSGTTWVGSTVGLAQEVLHLYEPFNVHAPLHMRLSERYLYLQPGARSGDTEQIAPVVQLGRFPQRVKCVGRAARCGPFVSANFPAAVSLRELLLSPRSFLQARRVCFKDPLAFFAAEWLHAQHAAQVVVCMRHPAGVISSYCKLGWDHELDSLLRQPALRERFTSGLEDAIRRFEANRRSDRLGALILQWRIFAEAVLLWSWQHPDWMFITHEHLCQDPVGRFRALFDFLDLRWTPAIERKILADTNAEVVDPQHHVQHIAKRNSRALAEVWTQRLDNAAIRRIEAETLQTWEQLLALTEQRSAPVLHAPSA